ncbi:MAG: hypothetical protein AAGM22_07165 [Acidobacteriota bacterium]
MKRPTTIPQHLLAAALGSAAIVALWPPGDSLYSTVVLLPWAVLLLSLTAVRLGAELNRPVRLGLLLPTAALILLAPARHLVGWTSADRLWISALLALAAWALWRLLPSLRRALEARPPWPVFFVVPLAFYLVLQPFTLEHRQPDGDEPYYLLLTHSLAYDGDVDLANNYRDEDWRQFMTRAIERQPGDPVGENGEVFSRHNALLPVVLAPAYRLAGRTGATAMMAVMAAAVAWLFLVVARRRWPEAGGGALLAWALLALTPPLLLYSHQIWIEVPAALLALFAFDRLERLRQKPRGRDLGLLALTLCLLPLLKLRLLLVAVALLALALVRLGGRRAAAVMAAVAAAVSTLLLYNYWRYGNPLKMYSTGEFSLFTSPPSDWLRGAIGMFYDCAFGLFATAPLWLLLVPAVFELVRRRDRFAVELLAITAPYLAALAPRLEWYGGWSPPFRYPLVFLPFFALAMVPLFDRRPAGTRIAITALGVPTAVILVLLTAVPGWTYNLADGSSHLLHQASILLEADVSRFFPSTVRIREATWWWLGASILLSSLALLDSRRLRGLAPAIALTGLGAVAAALPFAAPNLPTRIVEAEDAWVRKTAGRLEPERWAPARPRFRGGWRMTSQTGLSAPVIAGGERAILRVHAKRDTIGPHRLELFADQTPLGSLEIDRISDWRTFEFGPLPWPTGARLLVISPQYAKRDDLGLLLDRVDIEWLDADDSGEVPE